MFQPLKVLPCSPFLKFQNNASERLPIHFNYVRDVRNFLSWLSSLDCFYLNCSKYRNRYLPLHPALPPPTAHQSGPPFCIFHSNCHAADLKREAATTMNHHLRCEIICPPRGGPQPLRDEAAAGHLRDHSLCPPAHCARGDRCTTATLLCLIHGGTVPFPATTAAHTTPVAPPAAQVEKRSWSCVTPGGTHHLPLPHSPPPGEPQIFLNTAQMSSNPNTP